MPRRRCPLALLGALAFLPAPVSAEGPPVAPGPIGVAPASRAGQARAEARALAVPSPEKARAWLRTLTEEPHVAGTPADRETALFVRDRLREWGWSADLVEYEVLLNYPYADSVKLEILRPEPRKLPIIEEPLDDDKDSADPRAFPAFHGYGASGNVSGQVVYANYGKPEDFKALEKMGVSVKGKIVLVRYGGPFRGLKLLNAQKRGAAGVLIYSDPADDGYGHGDTFPKGRYRPPSAIQRGSVQFLSLGPGDPSTPHGPSVKGAKRLPIHQIQGFPTEEDQARDWSEKTGLDRASYFATIPSLPISYAAARPILEALGGPSVPSGWQGGLPLPYHIGPGPVEVRMAIMMDYKVRTIWNVIATLKGEVEPDRWVMIGNHRDAWVYGAVDPGSGTAATLETCRALGEAVRSGWKPRRTVLYASWDAEEYGLVGSTEWAEDHAEELDAKAVLMLNVDAAISGPTLDLGGVPSLRDLVLDAAGGVTDARTGKTLRESWLASAREHWAGSAPLDLDPSIWEDGPASARERERERPAPAFSPRLDPLGSGSDYTVFLDHLGVPSLDVQFRGGYGVYHSVYDDFFWMEKFGDPEFLTHATAAKLYALIAMRAAGAEVVPLKFAPYGEELREFVDDLRRITLRKARAAGPDADAARPPVALDGLPRLVRAVRALRDRAEALDRATDRLADRDGIDPDRLARVNDGLVRVERAFLDRDGLPGRPWFRHLVYAPGLTTGYAPWPLPGVRQAIEDDDPELLSTQLDALVSRLDSAADAMRSAAEAAEAAGR